MRRLCAFLIVFVMLSGPALVAGQSDQSPSSTTVEEQPSEEQSSGDVSTNATAVNDPDVCWVKSYNPHQSGNLAKAHGRAYACTTTVTAKAAMTLARGDEAVWKTETEPILHPGETWKSEISMDCVGGEHYYAFTVNWAITFLDSGLTGYATTGKGALVPC